MSIVGAGIAGLATAIRLAARGFHVTVFERSSRAGGKLDQIEWEGFRWDTGPSMLTLSDLLEELFVLAGEEMKTSIRCRKLEMITRFFYEDGKILNAYADAELFAEEAEKVLGEPADHVIRYLERNRKIFELTSDTFIFNKFLRTGTLFSQRFINLLLQLWKLDSMVTMHDANTRRFGSRQLVQIFDRYATYNGSDPYRAPGTLNLISHLEHNLGACFPERGIASIAKGLKDLADKLGVVFHFNEHVEKVVLDGRVARGVVTGSGIYSSDIVVSDIDLFYLYRDLLEDVPFPMKQFRKERGTSALIFYWAMDREFPQLELHNVFFSDNYREEFRELEHKQGLYHDPTIYLFISSRIVTGDAPPGKENWYVMINVPENLGQDWDVLIGEARKNILDKLYRMLGTRIESLILKEFVADPRSIEIDHQAHRGSLYGSSSNSRTAAFTRHPNYMGRFKGLYFVGGTVHPGGGIPLCLASAKIVDGHIR